MCNTLGWHQTQLCTEDIDNLYGWFMTKLWSIWPETYDGIGSELYKEDINFWQGETFNAFALSQCHFYRYFGASLTFIDNSDGQSTDYIYSLDYS